MRVCTNLRAIDDLLLQGRPRKGEDVGHHRVQDEVVVAAQLRARERRDALQEQRSGGLDVSRRDQVKCLVHLEAIAPVPVSP